MRNISKLLAFTAISASFAGAALAADLPYYGGNSNSGYSKSGVWQGFYAGAHVGFMRGTYATTTGGGSSKFDMTNSSLSGGLFGGHNWQFGQYVVGGEIDATMMSMKKSALVSGTTYTANSGFNLSARARLGYALDNLMLFTTAGLSTTSVDFKGAGVKDDDGALGYVIGAGAEVKFTDKIFGRGEYLYSDYGKQKFMINTAAATTDTSTHAFRVGVGYKF